MFYQLYQNFTNNFSRKIRIKRDSVIFSFQVNMVEGQWIDAPDVSLLKSINCSMNFPWKHLNSSSSLCSFQRAAVKHKDVLLHSLGLSSPADGNQPFRTDLAEPRLHHTVRVLSPHTHTPQPQLLINMFLTNPTNSISNSTGIQMTMYNKENYFLLKVVHVAKMILRLLELFGFSKKAQKGEIKTNLLKVLT